jgi:hypothetical protein
VILLVLGEQLFGITSRPLPSWYNSQPGLHRLVASSFEAAYFTPDEVESWLDTRSALFPRLISGASD